MQQHCVLWGCDKLCSGTVSDSNRRAEGTALHGDATSANGRRAAAALRPIGRVPMSGEALDSGGTSDYFRSMAVGTCSRGLAVAPASAFLRPVVVAVSAWVAAGHETLRNALYFICDDESVRQRD